MIQVLLTHGDSVLVAPPTCRVVGYSGDLITAIQHKTDQVYGVQFHPEVQLTVNGTAMIRNFLYKVWYGLQWNLSIMTPPELRTPL